VSFLSLSFPLHCVTEKWLNDELQSETAKDDEAEEEEEEDMSTANKKKRAAKTPPPATAKAGEPLTNWTPSLISSEVVIF